MLAAPKQYEQLAHSRFRLNALIESAAPSAAVAVLPAHAPTASLPSFDVERACLADVEAARAARIRTKEQRDRQRQDAVAAEAARAEAAALAHRAAAEREAAAAAAKRRDLIVQFQEVTACDETLRAECFLSTFHDNVEVCACV